MLQNGIADMTNCVTIANSHKQR